MPEVGELSMWTSATARTLRIWSPRAKVSGEMGLANVQGANGAKVPELPTPAVDCGLGG